MFIKTTMYLHILVLTGLFKTYHDTKEGEVEAWKWSRWSDQVRGMAEFGKEHEQKIK